MCRNLHTRTSYEGSGEVLYCGSRFLLPKEKTPVNSPELQLQYLLLLNLTVILVRFIINSSTMKVYITSTPQYPKENIDSVIKVLKGTPGELEFFAGDPLIMDDVIHINEKFENPD